MPEVRMPEMAPTLAGGWRLPLPHLLAAMPAGLAALAGGPLGLGSWGIADLRLLGLYVLAALLLHAWSTAAPSRPAWARAAAWLTLVAMCVHSGVLLEAALIGALLLLGALDVAVHAVHAPVRRKLPLRTLAAAAAVVAGAAIAVLLLAVFATEDAAVRLGAAAVLAAALVVACAARPTLRSPQWLLPALGLYYLFFVLAAVPVLPFGPAVAWWLLCLSLMAGAFVAARHVSGDDLPPGIVRHRHVVQRLEDPRLAARAAEVERFLAGGVGAGSLAERIASASGRAVRQDDLLPPLDPDSGAPPAGGRAWMGWRRARGSAGLPGREAREAALRRVLGVPP